MTVTLETVDIVFGSVILFVILFMLALTSYMMGVVREHNHCQDMLDEQFMRHMRQLNFLKSMSTDEKESE